MKYEIVEYANELNDLNLSSFSLIDKRIFFSILSQCKNQPAGKEIILTKRELIRLGIYPDRKRVTLRQFARDLGHVVGLCYSMYFHKLEETDSDIWIRNIRLFDQIDIKVDKKNPEDLGKIELHFKIEKKAKEFLDTVLPFTSFPLPEFQSLRSIYSQDLFLHLKQYKNQGKYFVKQSDFRKYLNIPKSYRQCDIDRRILSGVIKELQAYFPNLHYKKIRDENDKRKIGRYEFYWDVPGKRKKLSGNGRFHLSHGDPLPTTQELIDFKNKENLEISPKEMIEILSKKLEKEDISSWQAYLKGAAKNIKDHHKKKGHPSWWDIQDNEEVTPELFLEVSILQKLNNGNKTKEDILEMVDELMKENEMSREEVIEGIERVFKAEN